MARHFDVLAATVTGRAGLLYCEKALLHTHLAVAMTRGAGFLGRTWLSAIAITAVTLNVAWHTDVDSGTGYRTLKVQLQVVAKVGATCGRIRTTTAAAARATENITKHIAEDVAKVTRATTTETAAAKATALAINTGMTKLVVRRTFFAIAKHFVSF